MPERGPFIGTAELAQWVEDKDLHLIDARAPRAYAAGHLPGAVNLDARYLNPEAGGVRTRAEDLEVRLASLGVGAAPTVVYGAHGGADAAHVWWTLRAHGHPQAYLSDGGIEAWEAESLPLSRGEPGEKTASAPPPATPDPSAWIELAELRDRLEDPSLYVMDTRAPEEFTGEDRIADRGGHVPGAHLLPWDDLLESNPPRLRPLDALRGRLGPALKAPEVVTYCQSGVRAAHTFAVLELLDHPRPRLYLGSWAEWGNDPSVPVSTAEDEIIGKPAS